MDKRLYLKLINNIAKAVKQLLNEKKDPYESAKEAVHNRVKKAFIEAGYNAQVVSKTRLNMARNSDPIIAMEYAHMDRNLKKSLADLKLIRPSEPYVDLTKDEAFIMLQQRSKKNPDTFRVELNPDLTDIAGNDEPTKNVTYVAFVDKNLFDTTEMDFYVVSKADILSVAHEVKENGRKTPGNKRIDNFGNWITFSRTGKNAGLVLKETWIKNNCIEKYHINPTPQIMSDYRTYRNY